MSFATTTYGLSIPATTPTGDAGLALSKNFTTIDSKFASLDDNVAELQQQTNDKADAADLAVVDGSLATHVADQSNPHAVTKAQVGLSNVIDALQLQAASNLIDLPDKSAARVALGLGSAATAPGTAFAPTSHTHAGSAIVTGTVPAARLGSGTPGGGNVLVGTGAWTASPSLSGTVTAAGFSTSGTVSAGTLQQGANTLNTILSAYLTTATAASTYATTTSLNAKANLAAPSFTGVASITSGTSALRITDRSTSATYDLYADVGTLRIKNNTTAADVITIASGSNATTIAANLTLTGSLNAQGSGAGLQINSTQIIDNSGNLRPYSITIPAQAYSGTSVGSTGSFVMGGHDSFGANNLQLSYSVSGNTSTTTFAQSTPGNNGQRTTEFWFNGENTSLNVVNVNDGVGIKFGWGWYAGRLGYASPSGNYGWMFALDGTNVGTIVPQVNSIGPVQYRTLIDDGSGRVAINWASAPTCFLDVNGDTIRQRLSKTPATSTASGNQGDHCWDANYLYVCTATNTWKRAALAAW